jgi:hypothetical protein
MLEYLSRPSIQVSQSIRVRAERWLRQSISPLTLGMAAHYIMDRKQLSIVLRPVALSIYHRTQGCIGTLGLEDRLRGSTARVNYWTGVGNVMTYDELYDDQEITFQNIEGKLYSSSRRSEAYVAPPVSSNIGGPSVGARPANQTTRITGRRLYVVRRG